MYNRYFIKLQESCVTGAAKWNNVFPPVEGNFIDRMFKSSEISLNVDLFSRIDFLLKM